MKPTEITLQVVKNMGNFESVRASVTYSLDGESTLQGLEQAKSDIDNAFKVLYEKRGIPQNDVNIDKIELTEDSPIFNRIKKGLKDGKFDLKQVNEWYYISDEINKLLNN